MYKAHWSEEKFVHITSKRFVDRVDTVITVKVYSNCPEVTLYVNGIAQETKTADRIFIFNNVALQDGVNEVKVVSNEDGVVLQDVARYNRVAEPNPSYVAPETETGGVVSNWFDMPDQDLDDIEIEELEITDDVYSTDSSLGDLLENKETLAVLQKYLGDKLSEDNPMLGMAKGMTIEMLATMAEEIFTDKVLYVLNRELTKIKK